MRAQLEEMGFANIAEPYEVKFRPTLEDLAGAEDWGRSIGRAIREGVQPAAPEE
jgi:hypothetical protein